MMTYLYYLKEIYTSVDIRHNILQYVHKKHLHTHQYHAQTYDHISIQHYGNKKRIVTIYEYNEYHYDNVDHFQIV